MIAKILRINLLLDFYAPLLTEKQRLALNLFYVEDFSLGEIAAACAISRQAVHDLLRRSEGLLEGYEKALGLAEKHQRSREKQAELEVLAKKLQKQPSPALWGVFWQKWQSFKEGE